MSLGPALLIGVLVLLPGILAWWWHRNLHDAGDPSVLSERVAVVHRRVAFATTAAAVFVMLSAGWRGVLALPVMLGGVAAAAYPTRRALYGETWSFHRYLAWRARVVVAVAGFFLLLGATPALISAAGTVLRLPAAAALLAVLLAWHHWHRRALLLIVGASPLQRRDLDEAFAPVLQRTTAPAPEVWHAGPAGGVIANALALPGLGRGGVLFFDTLLERLAPSEVGAIFAHEVAHLEHFTTRRMRAAYASGVIAIVLAGGLSLALAGASATFDRWYPRLWPVLVFAGLVARATRMQAHETESDVRAVQLCGDPEALVSALTRLHAIHHVPRRWAASVEEHATHPSLARRIRAIRAAAQTGAAGTLEAPLLVASREPGGHVLFDRDRVTFAWGAPAGASDPLASARRLEALAYDELSELRVDSTRTGAALVARARRGNAWRIPLNEHDLARVQAALDTVDQLLAPPLPSRQLEARRAAALLAITAAAALSSLFAVLVPAMLAVLRPTRRAASALAAGLVGAALAAGSDSILGSIRALVFALLAALALWLARPRGTEDERLPHVPDWAESLWLALPLAAGAIWIVASNRDDLFGLHTTARDGAWMAASAAALTGYLAVSTVRSHRRLSAGAALLAVGVLWFGSSSFLTAVVRDPLAVDMPFLRQRSEPVAQRGAASVDGVFARVRLSRDARYFLLSEYDADEYPEADGATQRHVVGTFDGWSRPIDAADVAFVDDTTLFVADRSAGGLRLRTEDVRGGRMRWSLTLDERLPVTLETGPGGRWRIVRRHVKAFATTAGRVGSQSVERTGWSPSTNPEEYVTHFLHDGDARALAVTGDWQAPRLRWLAAGWRSRTSFLGLGAEGASRLATSDLSVSCAQPPIGGRGPVCAAFDGRLTRFWKYDGDARRFEPLGQLRGFVWPLLHDSNGVFAAGVGGRPALLDFDRGEVVAFEGSRGGLDLASAAGYVVSVRGDGSRTEVTLYHAAARPVSTP